jgi:hypothetical protein
MKKLPAGFCRWEHRAVRFSQHCGVICLGPIVVEIMPTITEREESPGACRDVLIRVLMDRTGDCASVIGQRYGQNATDGASRRLRPSVLPRA